MEAKFEKIWKHLRIQQYPFSNNEGMQVSKRVWIWVMFAGAHALCEGMLSSEEGQRGQLYIQVSDR